MAALKVLVTGKGGSGSWACRGQQLGASLGATVQPVATEAKGYDIAVVVKRTPEPVLSAIRSAGIPWVWDVVDAYPQPEAYGWSPDEAVGWIRDRLKVLKPNAVIWPTQRMRSDVGVDGLVLPHHHRPGIAINPVRAEVRRVGYEGSPTYLGRWRAVLSLECRRRGWEFVENPKSLAELDIVVAMRDGGGYVSRHWKSNVKLANAHGSGTPFVGQAECGYIETASGAEYWAEDDASLRTALDWLTPQDNRQVVSDRFRNKALTVEAMAGRLSEYLRAL